MTREDAAQALIILGNSCDSPFPEKETLQKIESAFKKETFEINNLTWEDVDFTRRQLGKRGKGRHSMVGKYF